MDKTKFQIIRIKRGEQTRLRLIRALRIKRNGGNKPKKKSNSSVWYPQKKSITPAEIEQTVKQYNRPWWLRLGYLIKKLLRK